MVPDAMVDIGYGFAVTLSAGNGVAVVLSAWVVLSVHRNRQLDVVVAGMNCHK